MRLEGRDPAENPSGVSEMRHAPLHRLHHLGTPTMHARSQIPQDRLREIGRTRDVSIDPGVQAAAHALS
jgi:hypothetical protein